MHDDVQPTYIVDSHANYTSDSNMILYDQEQVELYERRARFELTEREQKIDEQLRIVITDRNIKEEIFKKELHSVKMQLASTINHNKSMVEEVTSLKKDFKQKENKYLEEFLDMKTLKEKNKVAIGYKNPLCLTRVKQVQPALYNGYEIIKNNHVLALVHNTEDTLEIAEITRRKMNDKMKDHEYLIKLKEEALKERTTASRPIKALMVYPPNTPATLVPMVLPTKSQTLKEHFEGIQKALTKEIKEIKDVFEELEAEVDQNVVDRKHDEIERKNLLIAHDNLIADCLSKEVFYVATNSELNVSRFTEMHDAHTIVEARCLELEAELSNLRDKIQNDNHNELVKRFSNLEVNHLNLQLKYQNLKESFGNNPSTSARDTLDFDSAFVIGKMKASHQGKDNVINKLKTQISNLQETRSEADRTLDFRALDFQITQLTEKVTVLQEQNELFRAENAKIKQHYRELYDSIKITRAKHIEQTISLTTENENLTAQMQTKMKIVTKDHVKPIVLALGKYAIDVEPITPRNRNNREVHLDYLRHLKESVETLREIVEEAKVERPLDRKKQVTFEEQCDTSNSNTHIHVGQLNTQQTNVPVPPSTGVNCCTNASGSQPRSNTKKNKISPAKGVNKKKVEEHPRTNKSNLRTMNRVDSSSSSKRTVVQIVLWYLNSGCSKHMTGDRSQLRNFVKKFIGIVRFRNDHFGAIMDYGDYVIGGSVISKVYYVEGLGQNLFSVGQFCDSDLEVAFRKHTCYVRDTNGVELIKGSRGLNLYSISIKDMMKSSPICLLSKSSKKKSWLWHRRLNHLNFGTINDLARKDLVRGLPRLKFEKDHLCSACQLGKSKKHTHKPKPKNTNLEVLNTIHKDLCGLMRVQTINGKKYNLVIVDDYSRFTWVKFLRSKDETPAVVIKFLKQIQVGLNKTAPMFLWAEAVATACYTQNRSLIHTRHDKTPYELVHDKKPDLTFFHVFGALCYLTNDNEDLGKLQPTYDIGIFVGYAPSRKAPYVPPTDKELEILFQPMFDEYLEPPRVERPVSPALAVSVPVNSAGTPSSTTIDQDAPSPSHLPSSSALQSPSLHQGVAADSTLMEDNPFAPVDNHPFINVFAPEPSSEASSSGDLSSVESPYVSQTLHHLEK
ncbi:retrovirus-related pol polyprotein from transposon TNT 1-94 [Tanacetum coccineum]